MLVNPPLIASSASSRAATTTTSSINSRYVLACEPRMDPRFTARRWLRISTTKVATYLVTPVLSRVETAESKRRRRGGGDSFSFLRWMRARRGYSKHCFLRASRQSRAFHRVRSLFRKFSFECLGRPPVSCVLLLCSTRVERIQMAVFLDPFSFCLYCYPRCMYLYGIRYRNERFLETIINETIFFFLVASKVAFFLDPFSFVYIILDACIYIG